MYINKSFISYLLYHDYCKTERKQEVRKEKEQDKSELRRGPQEMNNPQSMLHISLYIKLLSVEDHIRPHLDPYLSTHDQKMLVVGMLLQHSKYCSLNLYCWNAASASNFLVLQQVFCPLTTPEYFHRCLQFWYQNVHFLQKMFAMSFGISHFYTF